MKESHAGVRFLAGSSAGVGGKLGESSKCMFFDIHEKLDSNSNSDLFANTQSSRLCQESI